MADKKPASKKTGLGRGLDALLGGGSAPASTPARPVPVKPGQSASVAAPVAAASSRSGEPGAAFVSLPLDVLQRGAYQPRLDMRKEALQELADSIRTQGVIQPIVVRPLKGADDGRYEIIAGERRWRAANIAELDEIPVIIRDIPDSAAVAVSLIENIQREDLNPLEEALALKRLIDEFEVTHQKAAEAVGKSRAAVSNLLRLLDLGPEARNYLRERQLDMGHARALLGIQDKFKQARLARVIVDKGLSVRETEAAVRKMLVGDEGPAKFPKSLDKDTQRLQDDLSARLGASVAIQHTPKGKGKLVINYNSLDELDGILAHIK
ncbi:MAG: ParB/RepB/Spo0J family partition protein [Gammaproteobacteria bacterium]|nr:ParB/RepB/Spo0J family partition protein [Gammaproteobacteria bacterium]